MLTIQAGSATINGQDGADYWLKHYRRLPDYYITKEEALQRGWIPTQGNLDTVAPGKMVYADYENREGRLPNVPGRVWYEADINYITGKRNSHRILFSNDGLLFVSYDHCKTFYEMI